MPSEPEPGLHWLIQVGATTDQIATVGDPPKNLVQTVVRDDVHHENTVREHRVDGSAGDGAVTGIGSLNEKPLHAALKEWYRQEGDQVEAPLDGFVVDLVRGDLLIEIQTRGFSAMRRKFDRLLDAHTIRLVHPVAAMKWIVKLDDAGHEVSRKRSPKRGIAADVCGELVSFPSLLSHPNFELEVALVEEEEIRRPDAKKGWRRGGFVIEERRLVDVVETVAFDSPQALLGLLPDGLPDPFTTADLADGLGRSRHLGREVAYCLRVSGAVATIGRDKRGILYRLPGPGQQE
ncbi:MAG: hypothetical protein QNL12_16510 [Acidimicrobiia bacterium]|nr:hypothetical protein [Acidimicrobiia bacterium]MDX2468914.1 hypothetical protein [Acidimicrobiia bacterium]